MYDFLARKIDSERFDELISLIKKNKCIAFIGAGLSRPMGYRVWKEGIIESSSPQPTLIQLAGIPIEEAQRKTLPEIIDDCKEILGEAYFEFLKDEFGANNKNKRHLNLYFIWNSNFQHYITTNFDISLYDNREHCRKLITYPSKGLICQIERTLYHIHGRAFITKKENEATLRYYLETLIYGKQSYIDAYDQILSDGAISSFIYSLIQQYSLLFIGFSMNDEDFKNTYKEMKLKWERYLKKINAHPQRPKEDLLKHFILLPYPYKSDYENENEFQKQKEDFEYIERQLSDINIFVISYNKMDTVEHKGLVNILEYIMEEAPLRKKAELFEVGIQPLDSSSASTSEVEK